MAIRTPLPPNGVGGRYLRTNPTTRKTEWVEATLETPANADLLPDGTIKAVTTVAGATDANEIGAATGLTLSARLLGLVEGATRKVPLTAGTTDAEAIAAATGDTLAARLTGLVEAGTKTIPTAAGGSAASDIGASAGATTADKLKGLVGFDAKYGEMYAYGNAVVETVDTNDTHKAVRNFVAGTLLGFTFSAGSTGAITAFADYDGTVAGTTLVTSIAHGLLTDDVITVLGTTSYDGRYKVTKITNDTFYIVKAFVADDATGNWYKPNSLRAGVSAAGVYLAAFAVTADSASANELYELKLNVGTTPADHIASERNFGTGGDYGQLTASGFLTVAAGDDVWLSFKQKSAGTDEFHIQHGNVNLSRISVA